MGRKQRKNRDKDVDSLDDQVSNKNNGQSLDDHPGDNDDANSRNSSGNNSIYSNNNNNNTKKKRSSGTKDLDFAERRELQRKQAAEKRRSKMKCYICGQAGHARRECPGVADDGRGMSRYRGRTSNVKNEKEKYEAKKQERLQKIQNNNGVNDNTVQIDGPPKLPFDYPQGFSAESQQQGQTEATGVEIDTDSILYYDSSCDDVLSTINYIKEGRGKEKLSKREAMQEYQQALEGADAHSNFGGMISRSLIKPSRPWIQPTDAPLPHKVWYQLGLARDYLFNDNDVDAAVATLVHTLNSHEDTIVGFWTVLDYSPQYRKRPGCDIVSQLRRARATCRAAAEAGVTVQLQVLPGAPPSTTLDNTESSNLTGSDYAQVLLDLQTLLSEMIAWHPQLTVVLSHWCGMAQHMMTFLNAFSKDNLVIGLDGAVSFSKASVLHECAFDVPLDRLLLGTGTVIPSEIANAQGRDAFYHAGLLPFVAKAVAHYKKTVSTIKVAQVASALAVELYPQLARARSAHESTEHGEEASIGGRGETEDDRNGDEAENI